MKTIDFTEEEERLIDEAFEELLEIYMRSGHSQKEQRVRSAFDFARKAHNQVRRKSGEPYIHHPIAVARIVCEEMGLGSTSICCALLHDVVEDTDYTVENIAHFFDAKVAEIVDGLTKIKGEKLIGYEVSLQAENFRRLVLTMNDDPRVVLIKIADRLHNLRTLGSMRPDKQKKISGETLEFFAPLAHRLGLYAIKSELENLSFKYDQPERYNEISKKLLEYEEGVESFFHQLIEPLEKKLKESKLNFEIKYRLKGIYSISQKMRRKKISFEEMADIFAVRIVFDTDKLSDEILICRQIQAYVEQTYQTRPDRLRDWLIKTKPNGYQALHLTVMLPSDQKVEIQIRSRRMHEIAEQGLAAHWRYKEGGEGSEDVIMTQLLAQMRDILQYRDSSATEFLDNFKASLYANDIYVFTPKGKEFHLPFGATVLDFAYAIHSELGDECMGAKIDHKLYPRSHKLKCGDQVEILNVKGRVECEPTWLDMAVTPNAKVKIQATLRRLQRVDRQKGEELFNAILEKFGIVSDKSLIDNLSNFYGLKNQDDLYLNLGTGEINLEEDILKIEKAVAQEGRELSIKEILSYISRIKREGDKQSEPLSTAEPVDQKDVYKLLVKDAKPNYLLASCCRPIKGDEVMGVITKNGQVYVHRSSCPRAMEIKSTQGDKLLSVMWAEQENEEFLTNVFISGVDTKGLLGSICNLISIQLGLRINAVNVSADDGVFEGKFEVYVPNLEVLEKLFATLKELDNIISAKRIED